MAPRPRAVYRRLLKAYGPRGWWPVTPRGGSTARYRPGRWGGLSERQRLEVCVGALLTQNTNWSNAARALDNLRRARMLGSLAALARHRLAPLIRPSGYFNQKALKLRAFARHVLSRRRSLGAWLRQDLAGLREELLDIFGVGPETADSILLYAGGRPALVIDAYTLRIGRRLGWFSAKTSYHDAQAALARLLPAAPRLYGEFHALMVELGKRHCRAAPVCAGCPVSGLCRHARAHAA